MRRLRPRSRPSAAGGDPAISDHLSDQIALEPRATVTVNDIKRYYHVGIVNGGFTAGAAVDMARGGVAGLLQVLVQWALSDAGLDPVNDVTFKIFPPPQLEAAVEKGEVQAFTMYAPFPAIALNNKSVTQVFSTHDNEPYKSMYGSAQTPSPAVAQFPARLREPRPRRSPSARQATCYRCPGLSLRMWPRRCSSWPPTGRAMSPARSW